MHISMGWWSVGSLCGHGSGLNEKKSVVLYIEQKRNRIPITMETFEFFLLQYVYKMIQY